MVEGGTSGGFGLRKIIQKLDSGMLPVKQPSSNSTIPEALTERTGTDKGKDRYSTFSNVGVSNAQVEEAVRPEIKLTFNMNGSSGGDPVTGPRAKVAPANA